MLRLGRLAGCVDPLVEPPTVVETIWIGHRMLIVGGFRDADFTLHLRESRIRQSADFVGPRSAGSRSSFRRFLLLLAAAFIGTWALRHADSETPSGRQGGDDKAAA